MAHRIIRLAMAARLLLVATAAAVTVAPTPVPAAGAVPAAPAVRYLPPVVGGTIVDHFRPPPTPYGSGNRGVDEWVPAGTPVHASAAGEVVFAGEVAGALHLTIRHPDGLRTTYSFLTAIAVHRGDRVAQGALIGVAGGLVHFGVRDPLGHYLDPEALWAGRIGASGAHLVPGPDEGAPGVAAAASEPALLDAVVRQRHRPASEQALARVIEAASTSPDVALVRLTADIVEWGRSQADCTPASRVPPRPAGRRLAILVGGLGSSAASAAVDHVDLGALGYRPRDVVRFSYRGGRVPNPEVDRGPLGAIAATTYDPTDTTGDLRAAATRLRDLITAVHQVAPGVPVDLIAHSQGGVVARLALSTQPGAPVDLLVTLATPHQGAELATADVGLGGAGGALVDRLAERAGLAAGATAVAQLSQGSDVVAELLRPLDPHLRMLSIGASGDLSVPAGDTPVPGAANVVVHLGGLHAHDDLPGQPSVTREIALARAGLAPTCVPWGQGIGDILTADAIARAEAAAGTAAVGIAGR